MVSAGVLGGCDAGGELIDPVGIGPAPRVLVTVPADEAVHVPPSTSISIQLDRFLFPGSVNRQAVCVTTQGRSPATGPTGCVFVRTQYDPVDRIAVFRPGELTAGVRYTVTLGAASDKGAGLRAIDGAPLPHPVIFHFTTSTTASPPLIPPRQSLPFCGTVPQGRAPVTIFARCAAGLGCHGPPEPASSASVGPPAHSTGVRFPLDPASIARYVHDETVAIPTDYAPDPTRPHRDVFGENMPYFAPQDPGRSYALYKMILALGRTDGELTDPPSTAPSEEPIEPLIPRPLLRAAAAGEIERLRSFVRGEPMPDGTRVDLRDVRAISGWIASGAMVTTCPDFPRR